MPKRRQKFSAGDYFSVPVSAGIYAIGQVLALTPKALNSIGCAFGGSLFPEDKICTAELTVDPIISIQLVTPDLLHSGRWQVRWHAEPQVAVCDQPYEEYRDKGWVGAKIRGSANIESFIRSYHGFEDWHQMKDPDYFEQFLLPGAPRPDKSADVTR